MKAKLPLIICLSVTACFCLCANAQTQVPQAKSTVTRQRIPGAVKYPGEEFLLVTGKVRVLNAHTLVFDDGTEVELNGVIDAAEPEQKAMIGDAFYPCGKEAAEFLRKLIGDQAVTCFASVKNTDKLRGECFIGETNLKIELVRNGWATAHHSSMEAWEAIARENKRGLWRGKFMPPERWRRGERLPGESVVTKPAV